MPQQRPPPVSHQREIVAPAPHLTVDNLCSDCRVRPMPIANGKVCPNCYAMLWHDTEQVNAAEVQKRLLARQQAADIARENREIRKQTRREAYRRDPKDTE